MKTYRYRKHIRLMGIVVPIILIVLAVFIFSLLPSISQTSLGSVTTMLAVLIVIEAVVIYFVMARLAKVEVSLGNENLSYFGKGGRQEIPYEDITALKYSIIPYAGGWIKIITGATTIRLTVVLEGIGEFIEELKSRLDQSDLSGIYERSKLFRFYKTATYCDQSWARICEFFWKIAVVSLLLGIVSGSIGYFQSGGNSSILGIEIWVLSPVVGALIVYCVAEFILMCRFAKACDEENFTVPGRDVIIEKRIFKCALLIGVPLYVVSVITVLLLLNS